MKERAGWVEYFVYWMVSEGTEGLGGILCVPVLNDG